MLNAITAEFTVNSLFIVFIFTLRNVEDKFNMNWELQRVTFCKIIFDSLWCGTLLFFTDTVIVVYGFLIYFQIILSLLVLYISVIEPIRGTYKPNSIIPFALNEEAIKNVESAMAHKISSRYFFNFLCNDLRDASSLTIFSLYSDLRHFNILCCDKNANFKELKKFAT